MKSICLNIRALAFDGKTPLPSSARITYNSKTDSHDVVGGPLGKFGLLPMRDLVARDVIAATHHVYASWVGHSGQSGVTNFVVRSCHVGLGRQVSTSPTRQTDPSADTGQVGSFALGPTDELVLISNAGGEQTVTLALLVGTAVEVERLRSRDQELEDAVAIALHAATHESGGADELDVSNLAGYPGDNAIYLRGDGTFGALAPLAAHASGHQNGGSDELDLTGLSGLLATPQSPTTHASSHENGASDEIDLTGLSGLLATPQTPTTHASSHSSGSSDPINIGSLAGYPGTSTSYLRGDGAFVSPLDPILCHAAEAYLQSGLTAASLAESAGEKPYLVYVNGSTTYASWFKQIPETYTGGDLLLLLWYTGDTSSVSNISWQTTIEHITAGQSIVATNATSTTIGTAPGPSSAGVHLTRGFILSNAQLDSASAGGWIRIMLARQGGAAADAYTGSAWVLGFQLATFIG